LPVNSQEFGEGFYNHSKKQGKTGIKICDEMQTNCRKTLHLRPLKIIYLSGKPYNKYCHFHSSTLKNPVIISSYKSGIIFALTNIKIKGGYI